MKKGFSFPSRRGKIELIEIDSSLIDMFANLGIDDKSVTVLTSLSPITTTGLTYAHSKCTHCSKTDVTDKTECKRL